MEKFDIQVKRNGNKNCTEVEIVVTLPLFVEKFRVICCLHFTWECGTEYTSALLEEYLQQKIWTTLEQIRKKAYEKGYSDHKKKQKKLTEFYQNFNPEDIGY